MNTLDDAIALAVSYGLPVTAEDPAVNEAGLNPARDLAAQYGAGGEEMLQVTLAAYEPAGGHLHLGMAAQARHLWEASPLGYTSRASSSSFELADCSQRTSSLLHSVTKALSSRSG